MVSKKRPRFIFDSCILMCLVCIGVRQANASVSNRLCAAGIFGGNRRGNDKNTGRSPERPMLPPPPPPPPGGTRVAVPYGQSSGVANFQHNSVDKTNTTRLDHRHQLPPPPPPPPNSQLSKQQQRSDQWNALPQPQGAVWGNPQGGEPWTNTPPQPMMGGEDGGSQEHMFHMQRDLDDAFQREQVLLQQLHNTTTSASALEQREKLHIHQLDVLTERVMDIEAAAAKDRNEALEYQANCTELTIQLAQLEGEVDKWRAKCSELIELRSEDEKKIRELKKRVRASTLEAEDLAAMIERHRLVEESGLNRKKKKVGFFAWLLGFGSTSTVEDEEYEEMQENARSTLLGALRNERKSVSELEVSVTSLQQNNSAIAEQVQSRDQIIDELNNRIAVFEEDKIVLKAALRQLQKEMNEEAPRTSKLVQNLSDAKEETVHLKKQIESILKRHKAEVTTLRETVASKQEQFQATESNLTVIGTYVDKLEERLADFTVARREIERREAACLKVEKGAKEANSQKDKFEIKVKSLEKEHKELKGLLSELAKERELLQDEKDSLANSQVVLKRDILGLRQSYAKLDSEAKSLRSSSITWEAKHAKLQNDVNSTRAANQELFRRLNITESENGILVRRSHSLELLYKEVVDGVDEKRQAMAERIAELELERNLISTEHLELAQSAEGKLQSQQRELETAREEQKRAFEAARIATTKAVTLEENLKMVEQKALNLQNQSKAAAAELERRTEEIQRNRQSVIAEFQQKLDAAERERKSASEKYSDLMRDMKSNMAKQEISLSQTGNDRKETGSRPKGAPILPIVKPYLPKSAATPKRQFGAGIIDPVEHNDTKVAEAPPSRNVPLRRLRKSLSKLTGVHGLVTPSSHLSLSNTTSVAVAANGTLSESEQKAPQSTSATVTTATKDSL